jgi:PBP1b-binding outer membrane lipoprotein LpoB
MSHFKILFAILLLTLIIVSCSVQKQKTKDSQKKGFDKIQFGNGGGFTGKYDHFSLFKDGSLLKINEKDSSLINTLSTDELQLINEKVSTVDLTSLRNDPGNYTYYIDIQIEDKVYKNVWSTEVDQNVKDLYKLLMTQITPIR